MRICPPSVAMRTCSPLSLKALIARPTPPHPSPFTRGYRDQLVFPPPSAISIVPPPSAFALCKHSVKKMPTIYAPFWFAPHLLITPTEISADSPIRSPVYRRLLRRDSSMPTPSAAWVAALPPRLHNPSTPPPHRPLPRYPDPYGIDMGHLGARAFLKAEGAPLPQQGQWDDGSTFTLDQPPPDQNPPIPDQPPHSDPRGRGGGAQRSACGLPLGLWLALCCHANASWRLAISNRASCDFHLQSYAPLLWFK